VGQEGCELLHQHPYDFGDCESSAVGQRAGLHGDALAVRAAEDFQLLVAFPEQLLDAHDIGTLERLVGSKLGTHVLPEGRLRLLQNRK
jgi:hypothetical protein